MPVGDWGGFGVIAGIHFSRPKEQPDWLIATTSLGIPYGIDTSVYVFEAQSGTWKNVLSVESNGYTEIRGAQGWLTHYVVPSKPGKKPFLVTAEVTPSPTSVWQGLRLRVLRVGPTPDRPVVVAKRSLSYCLDESYHIAVHADRFELIYLAEAVDPELAGFRGVHYLEYRLGEDGASVVHERAIDPYNMMNRWAAENWRVASKSVVETALEPARMWHDKFRISQWACGLSGFKLAERSHGDRTELIAVSECTQGRERTQAAYVTMVVTNGQFRIDSVSASERELNDSAGYIVYNGGGVGVTDPIPDSTPAPRLDGNISAQTANDAKLQFSIVVNEDGTVGTISIDNWPAELSEIVMPAIRSVRQWKYLPGLKEGRPAKVSVHVRILFQSHAHVAPAAAGTIDVGG